MVLNTLNGKHQFPKLDAQLIKDFFREELPAITAVHIPQPLSIQQVVAQIESLSNMRWRVQLSKQVAEASAQVLLDQLSTKKLLELTDKEDFKDPHYGAYKRQQNKLQKDLLPSFLSGLGLNDNAVLIYDQAIFNYQMFRDIFLFTDNPIYYHTKNARLHHDSEYAFMAASGAGSYVLNGTVVPAWLVKLPILDASMLGMIANSQVRAEFIRKMGLLNCLSEMQYSVLDEVGEYQLLSIFVVNRHEIWLKMKNPSVVDIWHLEPVHPSCKTVQDAINWRTYGDVRGKKVKIPVGVSAAEGGGSFEINASKISTIVYRIGYIGWTPEQVT